jgi:hypothetical protein
MKWCFGVALAGILSFWISEKAAHASTFELGNLAAGDTKFDVVQHSENQPFEDTFRFSLADLAASLSFQLRDLQQPYDIFDFKLGFFSDNDPATPIDTVVGPLGSSVGVNYFDLAAGNYFFVASGTTGPFGFLYRYDLHRNYAPGGPPQVDVVPLPPALLLFTTALTGLGLFGAGRQGILRRRSA